MNAIIRKFVEIGFVALITIGFAAFLIFGFAYFAMLFWNMFCDYAHLPEIGYWQMWGLMMFLSTIASVFKTNVTSNKE